MPVAKKSVASVSKRAVAKIPKQLSGAAKNDSAIRTPLAKAEPAKMAPAENDGNLAESPTTELDITSSVPSPAAVTSLKAVPNWKVWNTRPVISLRNAISLAHNIHPSSVTLGRLRRKKDERAKQFTTDLNTLISRLPFENSLPTVQKIDGVVTGATKVYLADFVAWIQARNPFPSLKTPPEFFALKPPRPGMNMPALRLNDSSTETSPPAKDSDVVNGESDISSEFKGKDKKTVSRILLALAMKHYGYRPRDGGSQNSTEKVEGGVYAPIAKLCTSLGFNGPSDWMTVKRALANAVSALEEAEIDAVLKT